jgi:NitT/TauT family transport system substrate-binding protein
MNRPIPKLLALLPLLALVACEKKHVTPPGMTHVILQTDWYPQPEHGGFYQAQLQGLYAAQGLDVEILPGGPGIVGGQVVGTGRAQFAMSSSDLVMVDNSNGIPEVAVAATMQQDPQAIMLHADSPIHTFADLDGHTISVRPGSIWFEYIVQRYHLTHLREIPATYSVANFVTDPDYIQQCFVTSEPFFAEHAGFPVRTLLISSTEYQPYRVYFTSPQYLAEHPDIVQKFVTASTQGWKNYLVDPTMVNAEIKRLNPAMRSDQMAFSIATLKSGHFIDGLGTPDSHLGHMTAARWLATYQQLVDLKILPHPIDPSKTYTLQFAP